jgi:uncharacterized membrane protein
MSLSSRSAVATATAAESTSRIQSIDIVRGGVMLLMAIDHVRVYSGIPAGGPDPAVFFTRWITHFCAPAFCFFAGTSAFLYGRKLADPRALARFLFTRGLLLVFLELTVIRFAWTFNFNYREFTLAGVIWMLGWCLVLLAGLSRFLSAKAVGVIGLAIVFFQQIFRFPPHLLPAHLQTSVGWIWEFVYPAGLENHSGIAVLYVLVPWIGVMAAGYGFGLILTREPAERRRLCLIIGLSATVVFLVFGCLFLFLNPAPAKAPLPALFRLLNQQKYPASQLYLLMTLGPIIALLPLAERAHGWFARALSIVGRVPMFYYLLHIPLIHLAALFVMLLREGQIHSDWYATAPYTFLPPEHRWGLPLLYLVWALVVVILYFPCRWFAGLKTRRRDPWLRYI